MKNRGIMRLTYVLTVFFLLLVSCSLDNPGAPAWFNTLEIAITEETYEMRELLEEDSSLVTGIYPGTSDEVLWIDIEEVSDPQTIQPADLSTKPDDDNVAVKIGTIELDDTDPVSIPDIDLSTIFQPAVIEEGTILPPNPSSFDVTVEDQKTSFTSFRAINITNGKVVVSVHNGFDFITLEQVLVRVYDDSLKPAENPTGLIAEITIPGPIAPGATSSNAGNPFIIMDQRISYKLNSTLVVTLAPRGTPHVVTLQDLNAAIESDIEINNIEVDYAEAAVPENRFEESDSTDVSDQEIQLRSGRISSGKTTIRIINELPSELDVLMTFYNLQKDGLPLVKSINLPVTGPTPHEEIIDLSDTVILNYKNPGEIIQFLYYDVDAVFPASNGFVEISSTDSIRAEVVFDSLYFSEINGILEETDITIDPIETKDFVDYGDFDGTIRLEELKLFLNFENEIGLDVTTNLEIQGIKRDESSGQILESVTIPLDPLTIFAGAEGSPVLTRDSLTGSDASPNIVDLMAILPNEIIVNGTATAVGEGIISTGQSLNTSFQLLSPLAINIVNDIEIDVDSSRITSDDISEDDQSTLKDNIKGAEFQLEIINHTPLSAFASVYIDKDSTTLFNETITDSSTKIIYRDIQVSTGIVGGDGFISDATVSTYDLTLTTQNIELLATPDYYTGVKLTLGQTGGKVIVRASDYIRIRGIINARIKIDPNQ
jgi:hypothetical protein